MEKFSQLTLQRCANSKITSNVRLIGGSQDHFSLRYQCYFPTSKPFVVLLSNLTLLILINENLFGLSRSDKRCLLTSSPKLVHFVFETVLWHHFGKIYMLVELYIYEYDGKYFHVALAASSQVLLHSKQLNAIVAKVIVLKRAFSFVILYFA